MIGRLVVLAAAATLALGATVLSAEPEQTPTPTPAPAPAVREVVPQAKLVKAVAARDAARAEARSLRRTLMHSPSVAEALTLASVVYGVPRSELSSVAWCESTHRPWARNGRYRGLFQMGPMFEGSPFGRAGVSVWSPHVAALTAAYTVSREGWSQWECSPRGAFAR